ncbi:unnamed protein product [Haemonchus placei]|uniref:Uncharacterized protein n=1 Tax=Haemonchus placei TaxID=6290 RepID=A0A3P7XQZ5_HAEPC|nr:unnamed protein product [Haemonchus placei]
MRNVHLCCKNDALLLRLLEDHIECMYNTRDISENGQKAVEEKMNCASRMKQKSQRL